MSRDPIANIQAVVDNIQSSQFVPTTLADYVALGRGEYRYKAEASLIFEWLLSGKPLKNNPLMHRRTGEDRNFLFKALREKTQDILNAIQAELQYPLTEDQAQKLKFLKNYLLAKYPYFEPPGDEQLTIPASDAKSQPITYKVRNIDVTPLMPFVAKKLAKHDRIHAVTLEAKDEKIPNYLIYLGTPLRINSFGGSGIAMRQNFAWRQGVDFTKIDELLATAKSKYIIIGDSQGTTSGLITAVKHADKVSEVYGFSPTKLTPTTARELEPLWAAAPKKPSIELYTPDNDFIYGFGEKFLEGAKTFYWWYKRPSNKFQDIHVCSGVLTKSFALKPFDCQQLLFHEKFLSTMSNAGNRPIHIASSAKIYNRFLWQQHGWRYVAPLSSFFLALNYISHKKTKNLRLHGCIMATYALLQSSNKAANIALQAITLSSVAGAAFYASLTNLNDPKEFFATMCFLWKHRRLQGRNDLDNPFEKTETIPDSARVTQALTTS